MVALELVTGLAQGATGLAWEWASKLGLELALELAWAQDSK
jgi:hypothetical protein